MAPSGEKSLARNRTVCCLLNLATGSGSAAKDTLRSFVVARENGGIGTELPTESLFEFLGKCSHRRQQPPEFLRLRWSAGPRNQLPSLLIAFDDLSIQVRLLS
jgi:hypothetical protein